MLRYFALMVGLNKVNFKKAKINLFNAVNKIHFKLIGVLFSQATRHSVYNRGMNSHLISTFFSNTEHLYKMTTSANPRWNGLDINV